MFSKNRKKIKPVHMLLAILPGLIVAGFWGFANSNPKTIFDGSLSGVMVIDANDTQKRTIIATELLFICGVNKVAYGGYEYETVKIGTQCWLAENLNIGERINTCADRACVGAECGQSCAIWDTAVNEQDNDSQIEKYCQSDSEPSCTTYGGLYQWAEAMALPYSCNSSDCSDQIQAPHQGICPDGWHIPSHNDWTTLERQICSDLGGTDCETQFPYDESTTGWRGTNGEGSAMAGKANLWTNGALKNHEQFAFSDFNVIPAGYRGEEGDYGGMQNIADTWSCSLKPDEIYKPPWFRGIRYDQTEVTRLFADNKTVGFSIRCLKD